MNVAIAEAANNRLLLLNSDAFVRVDTVERLDRRLDENPRLALCGAALFNPDGTRSKTHTFRFTFWRALADTLNIRPPIAQTGHGLELTHAVLPTCALARREALEEIGGFDERFLLYYEDLDVVQRLAQAGWLQAIDWDAEAIHVSGGSTSVGARQRWFSQYHRSRGIYMNRLETFASVNVRSRKNRIGSIGCRVRSSQSTNSAVTTAPTTSVPTICGEPQPSELPRTRPQTIPKRPALISPSPGRSSRVARP